MNINIFYINFFLSVRKTNPELKQVLCNITNMNVSEAFKSMNMKSMHHVDNMIRDELSRMTINQTSKTMMKFLPGPSSHEKGSLTLKHSRLESVLATVNKLVKRKLSLRAKIQVGGVNKVFRRIFSVREGEQLLRASQCCLSTTAGPVSGRLFISTEKLAFCSDMPIVKVSSPAGESLRFHYKVVIPLKNIKRSSQIEDMKKPSQKYLHVGTTDDFEFWFMGFLKFKKTFKCLQKAISQNTIIC